MPRIVSPRNDDNEFNVRAYGATGAGSADDAPAFQLAANAAMTFAASNGRAVIKIPGGTYKLNSTMIVSGGNVTVDAYGAYIFAGSNKDLMRDWVTQDSSFTLNGFGLIVQGGTWDLKGQNWGLSSNATLNAGGYSAFTISNSSQVTFRDVTVRNVYNYHCIDINTCEKVLIDGCRFEGFQNNFSWHTDCRVAVSTNITNPTTAPGATLDGVTMVAGDRVLLRAQTTTTQNGIYVWNSSVSMTRATDMDAAGEADRAAVAITAGTGIGTSWYQSAVNPTPGSAAMTWVQTTGFNTQSRYFSEAVQIDNGPNAIACKSITVNNCYMGPATDGSGLGSFGKMAGTHTDSSGQFYTNMRFTGNTSVGSMSNAFQGYSFADSVIANNTILGSQERGIRMFFNTGNSGPRLTISDNIVTDTVLHGIEIDGGASQRFRDVSITGNVITSTVMVSPATGIHVDTCDRLTIANNSISCTGSPSSQQGIYVEAVNDGSITGNRIYYNGTQGIQIGNTSAACIGMNVSGNSINGSGDCGIWIASGSQNCLIADNYIIGTNRLGTTNDGCVVISGNASNNNNTISNNKLMKGTGSATIAIRLQGASFTGTEISNNSYGADWGLGSGFANITGNNANIKLSGSDAMAVVSITSTASASTTLADITGSSITINMAGKYRFKAFLTVQPGTSTTSTVRVAPTGPTATNINYSQIYQVGNPASSPTFTQYQESIWSGSVRYSAALATASVSLGCMIDGNATITTTGTIKLQLARGAGTTNLTVSEGQFIVEKIA